MEFEDSSSDFMKNQSGNWLPRGAMANAWLQVTNQIIVTADAILRTSAKFHSRESHRSCLLFDWGNMLLLPSVAQALHILQEIPS